MSIQLTQLVYKNSFDESGVNEHQNQTTLDNCDDSSTQLLIHILILTRNQKMQDVEFVLLL